MTACCVHFALVHGTTQSPAGWGLLAAPLVDAGHVVTFIDLAGLPDDSTCAEFGREAVAQLPSGRADVVVAHSGSGLVLPAIASLSGARLQVFLAAFIPDGMRSLLDELNDDPAVIFHPEWIGVDPIVDHDAARRFLFHDCSEDSIEWALGTLRRFQPVTAYHETVSLSRDVAAVVIVPDDDRTVRSEWMIDAAKQRLGIEPMMIDGGHCPHVSRPVELARLLVGL